MRLTKLPLDYGADYLVQAIDNGGENHFFAAIWAGNKFVSHEDSNGDDGLEGLIVTGYKKLEA